MTARGRAAAERGASRSRGSGRFGAVFALALLAGAAPSAGDSIEDPGREETGVRVLLFAGPGPVRIERARGSVLSVRAGRRELWVNGRPTADPFVVADSEPARFRGVRYRGALTVGRAPEGLRVVNEVPLEPYLAGTLMREIYPGWDGEMLRAQAVVARTYALYQRRRRSRAAYHLRDGTRSQVYGGIDAESERAWHVLRETRGEYLSYRGRPILAVYHSASGGRTASAEEVWGRPVPYLVSVEVEGEERSPDTYWREPVSRPTLEGALEALGLSLGRVVELSVSRWSESGRARWVRVAGSEGSAEIAAGDLRRSVGSNRIRSTRFDVGERSGDFVFVGSGWGHGVGMSQWGGQAMARRGAGYRDILRKFYPGTRLSRLSEPALDAPAAVAR